MNFHLGGNDKILIRTIDKPRTGAYNIFGIYVI
jgi:hypothetical protein